MFDFTYFLLCIFVNLTPPLLMSCVCGFGRSSRFSGGVCHGESRDVNVIIVISVFCPKPCERHVLLLSSVYIWISGSLTSSSGTLIVSRHLVVLPSNPRAF